MHGTSFNDLAQPPRYIKIADSDNVAIIVNDGGLPAGSRFTCGLTLSEDIPQGHKVALEEIPLAGAIRRYGEIIGYASQPIARGSWVDESRVTLPPAPPLSQSVEETAPPAALPPLKGYTFLGYRNADGSVGTRNLLAITPSVQCVAGVVDAAVARIERELLPRYPNVDGVVGLNHLYGCGVAINAPAAIIPIRTLHNLAHNPNFGGEVMVVGLGCEKLRPRQLVADNESGSTPPVTQASVIQLQDEQHRGFAAMMAAIMQVATRHLARLNQRQRERVPASELVVGMQCGGSDAFSGVTANPALGHAADLLVRCGATVMFSEVTEVRDAVHLLAPRVINGQVAERLRDEMAWYDDYLQRGGCDRSANPSPGNKKGGLANVVEKALGSIAKAGSSAIVEVLSPGQRPTRRGLIFAATPASDFVCGTQQLASGITLQVFSTGRGTPYGLAAIPVVKVATRSELARRWFDLIDLDAGTIATGEETIEQVGQRLFELLLAVASGRVLTWSERWKLHNALAVFNPAPVT